MSRKLESGRNALYYTQMPPYVAMSRMKPQGLLGEMWSVLSNVVGLQSHYEPASINETANTTSGGHILLEGPSTTGGTAKAALAFGSSWYNVYIPESSLLTSNLSYIDNWSVQHWLLAFATTVGYTAVLFIMLRVAEKWYPLPHIDLPPLPPVAGKRVLKDINWRRALAKQSVLRVRNEESIGNCVMSGAAAVSGQGGVIFSHVSSIRLIVLTFLLFGMILSSAFSAMLVSQFTTGIRARDEEAWTLCFRTNSVQLRTPVALPRPSCSDLICSQHYAVLETPEIVREAHPQCTLVVFRERMFPFQIAIKLLPNTEPQLQNQLQTQLWKLMENGVASRLRRKWMKTPEITLRRRTTHTVSFNQIAGALGCYLAAIATSCLVLIVEKLIFYIRHRRVHRHWSYLRDY